MYRISTVKERKFRSDWFLYQSFKLCQIFYIPYMLLYMKVLCVISLHKNIEIFSNSKHIIKFKKFWMELKYRISKIQTEKLSTD